MAFGDKWKSFWEKQREHAQTYDPEYYTKHGTPAEQRAKSDWVTDYMSKWGGSTAFANQAYDSWLSTQQGEHGQPVANVDEYSWSNPSSQVTYYGIEAIQKEQEYKAAKYKIRVGQVMEDNPYRTWDEYASDTGRQLTDIGESEEYGGLSDLIQQLTEGPSAMELDEAMNYAAQLYGQTGEEFTERNRALQEQKDLGVFGQQGFSDEERALRERHNRKNVRDQEERASRMLENVIANTGSVSRYLQQADEAMDQIIDVQIRNDTDMKNEEERRQKVEWDALSQNLLQRVQSGEMSRSMYINQLQENKAMAMQGYTQQINMMFNENQQYLQMYRDELGRVNSVIQANLNAISTEMGIDQHMYESMASQLEASMAQYTIDLEAWAYENELDAQDYEQTMDGVDAFIEALKAVAEIAT